MHVCTNVCKNGSMEACMPVCLYVCTCMRARRTNVGHASWKQYSCSTAIGGSSEKMVVGDQLMAALLQHQ